MLTLWATEILVSLKKKKYKPQSSYIIPNPGPMPLIENNNKLPVRFEFIIVKFNFVRFQFSTATFYKNFES